MGRRDLGVISDLLGDPPANSGAGVVLVSDVESTTYSTISEALNDSISGDVVYVGPGSYSENITIPSGVSLIAPGGTVRTTINGTTGATITLNDNSLLKGFKIILPTDNSAAILSLATNRSDIRFIDLVGSGGQGIGISHTGAGLCDIRDLRYLSGDCIDIISTTSSMVIEGLTVYSGSITNGLNILTGGSIAISNMFISSSVTIVDCVKVGSGSLIMFNSLFEAGTNGVHITDGNASVDAQAVAVESAVNNHIVIDSTASAASITLEGGEWDQSTFVAPKTWFDNANLKGYFLDPSTIAGDESLKINASLNVGSPLRGYKSSLGGGGSYTDIMKVHKYDINAASGSRFTDITTLARSKMNSTFSFPSGAVGDCLYWASLTKFPGLELVQTVLMVPGSANIIWEYYNGSTWVAFNVCSSKSDSPYTSTADRVFSDFLKTKIRFDDKWMSSWVSADNIVDSIPNYGSAHYVVRARIANNPPTTLPVFEQSKLFCSGCTVVNNDGRLEFSGNAEVLHKIIYTQAIDFKKGEVNEPGSADIKVANAMTLRGKGNLFQANALSELYINIPLDEGVDTSRCLKLDIDMITQDNASGNFEIQVDVAILNPPIVYDGNNSKTTYSSIVASPSSQYKVIQFSYDIDVSNAQPNSDIVFRIFRNAGIGNDTVNGGIALLRATVYFVRYLS